jgi:hypothetical protein
MELRMAGWPTARPHSHVWWISWVTSSCRWILFKKKRFFVNSLLAPYCVSCSLFKLYIQTFIFRYQLTLWRLKFKLKVILRPSVSRTACLAVRHLDQRPSFPLLSLISCRQLRVWWCGRAPWQEVGSSVSNCCWSLLAQSLSGLSPAGLMTIYYCLNFETSLTWTARFLYLYPSGTG